MKALQTFPVLQGPSKAYFLQSRPSLHGLFPPCAPPNAQYLMDIPYHQLLPIDDPVLRFRSGAWGRHGPSAPSSSAIPGAGWWQALGEDIALATWVEVMAFPLVEAGRTQALVGGRPSAVPAPQGLLGPTLVEVGPKPDPSARLGLGWQGDAGMLATAGARRGRLPPLPSWGRPAPGRLEACLPWPWARAAPPVSNA